jgi:hypothetical protein
VPSAIPSLFVFRFCHSLEHPCHPRAELLGAATQKVKPRRVAASEAGAERVSNPWSSVSIRFISILDRIHKIEQNSDSDPAAAGLFILSEAPRSLGPLR